MNITITDNPYESENTIVSTRGVMTDAKPAKLNNNTKRPALSANWEKERPVKIGSVPMPEEPKDYSTLLNGIGVNLVNYAPNSNNTGAKKLRVNKIVCEKSNRIYNSTEKVDVIPKVEETKVEVPVEPPKEEPSKYTMEPTIVNSRSDIHGRHEHTGEIPVDEVREAVKNDNPVINRPSRVERNAMASEMMDRSENRSEAKAGDMDLYNDLLHNGGPIQEDVSKQLQGARKELSIEREESRKLAEKYGEAVKELEELKADIANVRKEREQKDKQELSATLNDLEILKKENLERTSDLSSIQAEIARLKAEKRAMEDNFYEDYRSYGRAA